MRDGRREAPSSRSSSPTTRRRLRATIKSLLGALATAFSGAAGSPFSLSDTLSGEADARLRELRLVAAHTGLSAQHSHRRTCAWLRRGLPAGHHALLPGLHSGLRIACGRCAPSQVTSPWRGAKPAPPCGWGAGGDDRTALRLWRHQDNPLVPTYLESTAASVRRRQARKPILARTAQPPAENRKDTRISSGAQAVARAPYLRLSRRRRGCLTGPRTDIAHDNVVHVSQQRCCKGGKP